MKKIAFALVVVAVAASPALAAKKSKPVAEKTAWELNEPGRRLFWDSMPVYWPAFVKAAYYSNPNNKK